MREIKFRVWDKVYGHFHEGDMINDYVLGEFIRNPEYMVTQLTGLKDKNGKYIYEGDIVHLTSEDGIDYNAQIVFEHGGFCAIDGTKDDYSTRRYGLMKCELNIEVIGNIYEDAELLE